MVSTAVSTKKQKEHKQTGQNKHAHSRSCISILWKIVVSSTLFQNNLKSEIMHFLRHNRFFYKFNSNLHLLYIDFYKSKSVK